MSTVHKIHVPTKVSIVWWLLAFLIINLATTGALAWANNKPSSDALSYYGVAQNLAAGKGMSRDFKLDLGTTETQPPFHTQGRFLYPYFVSLAFRWMGLSIFAANLVAAMFKALLVIPLVLVAQMLFDRASGLMAGVFYTLNPVYLSLGISGMPETTTAAFYYTSLLLLIVYYRSGSCLALLGAGLALSLSYLARPEGIFLVVLGLAIIAIRSRRWNDCLWFLAFPALTLTAGSWLIYGRPVTLSPYKTSLVTLPDWSDFYALHGFTMADYLERVGGIGGALAVRIYNCLFFLRNTFADGLWVTSHMGIVPFILLPATAVALIRPADHPTRRLRTLIGLFVAVQFVLTIGYPGYPRMSAEYRHGQLVGPFLIILTAAGLVFFWHGCQASADSLRRILCRSLSILLVGAYLTFALALITLVANETLWQPPIRDATVEAAEWIRDNLPHSAVIMTRQPAVVSYVSGRVSIVIPTARYAEIMTFAREHGGTHFLLTTSDRHGLPNLDQGLVQYADHFARLYTTDSFVILAVTRYDYTTPPTVEDDWYVSPQNARRNLWQWHQLWQFDRSNALEDVVDVWAQWAIRLRKGIWTLARDQLTPPSIRYRNGAQLGEAIELVGYDLNVERVRPGETVELTLYWQCLRPVDRPYTVFTHALDEGGIVRAQHDAPPLGGAHQTDAWEPGELIRDRHTLAIDPNGPPGNYGIEVGMYDPQTGERLSISCASETDIQERRVWLGPLKVRG